MTADLNRSATRIMNQVTVTASTLDDIREAVKRLAKKIDAPTHLLPTYGSSIDFGYLHIEINPQGFHFVIVERGNELERKTTSDPNELLYWIFEDVTFSIATDFELNNRIETQDSRRIVFKKQVELLGELDSSWKEREMKLHEKILKDHPFDDFSGIRAELCKNYRERGESPEVAWKMACEKYPPPK